MTPWCAKVLLPWRAASTSRCACVFAPDTRLAFAPLAQCSRGRKKTRPRVVTVWPEAAPNEVYKNNAEVLDTA